MSVPGYNSQTTFMTAHTQLDKMVQRYCDTPGCGFQTVEDMENIMWWEASLYMGYHMATEHLDATAGDKLVEDCHCGYDHHHLKLQLMLSHHAAVAITQTQRS
jgi:hypothetical protein